MTLKIRNSLLKIFFYISLAVILTSVICFIFAIINKSLLPPPDLRIPEILNSLPFAKTSLAATILAFALLTLYIPIVLFFINRLFENTQSTEIIFFSAFLLGIFCELARFYTICFSVWQTFTNLLIILGNTVLFGRILAPLSFTCAALLGEANQRQDIERNYMLMLAGSLVAAVLIPMNTARISSTGLVTEGFMGSLIFGRILLLIASTASFLIKGFKHSDKGYIKIAVSQFFLFCGYYHLIYADNFLYLIIGSALLYTGTYFYLRSLHKMYMWA